MSWEKSSYVIWPKIKRQTFNSWPLGHWLVGLVSVRQRRWKVNLHTRSLAAYSVLINNQTEQMRVLFAWPDFNSHKLGVLSTSFCHIANLFKMKNCIRNFFSPKLIMFVTKRWTQWHWFDSGGSQSHLNSSSQITYYWRSELFNSITIGDHQASDDDFRAF